MSLSNRSKQSQSTGDSLLDAILALIQTHNWDEKKRIIESCPDLLTSDDVDWSFDFLLEQLKNNLAWVFSLQQDRKLLARCQTEGIEAAFESMLTPTEDTSDQEPASSAEKLQHLLEKVQLLMRPGDMSLRITLCRDALKLVDPVAQPKSVAYLQTLLAESLLQCPVGNRANNLEEAITSYHAAVEIYTRDTHPQQWAAIQHNLAGVYYQRIMGNRADNIERAIHHYQLALEVCTRDTDAYWWSVVYTHLANAYRDRLRGERDKNIEQAIQFCQLALEVRTRTADPQGWASIQNNLATAYSDRISGERAENIERAIHHYQLALEVRTRDTDEWAEVQNNLARAYWLRIYGERAENIEQAIHHYNLALEVYTQDAFPEAWIGTMSNLAATYTYRVWGESMENIDKAIQYLHLASEVCTRDTFPELWATIQKNLGRAYHTRAHTRHKGWARIEQFEDLEKSIYHWECCLEVITRDNDPYDWASTQENLGIAYSESIWSQRTEKAIHHYQLALEVYTCDTLPAQHRKAQRNLGSLYFDKKQWDEALNAFRAAINAGDALLAAAYSEVGRKAEVSETAQLYTQAAYCLLRTGQPREALVMLERGKTRLLVEALALEDADLERLPDNLQESVRNLQHTIHHLEAEVRLPSTTPTRRSDRTLAELLREARAALAERIDEIRQDYPQFMPAGLDLDGILDIVPSAGALVAPLVTSQGSAIFVVPSDADDVTEDHVLWLDDFIAHPQLINEHVLDHYNNLDSLLKIWRQAYTNWLRRGTRQALETWQDTIAHVTGVLWNKLIEPVHQRLTTLKVERIILMPSGGLQLLPLHAAWYDQDDTRHYLLDKYEICYAPSAYALDICRQRAVERDDLTALVAGIGEYEQKRLSPLIYAESEAIAISTMLHTKPLVNEQATLDAVVQHIAGSAYVHFACHAAFDWDGNPLDSALQLYDRPLSLADIISLDLDKVRLVTLSACETGVTDIEQSPDEYVGLPAGFLQAGAPAVVSSLWEIDDASTQLLMERFYHNHLEKGLSYAVALREAQIWLRDSVKDKPYTTPYFWAAFTYMGPLLG